MTAPTTLRDEFRPDEPGASAAEAPVVAAAGRSRTDRLLLRGMAVAIWALVLFLGRVWGMLLNEEGHRMTLFTPPLLGAYREQVPWGFAGPVVLGVVLIAVLPRLALRLPWRGVLATGGLGSLAWWLALALADGTEGLLNGLEFHHEYTPYIDAMRDDPAGWLRRFIDIVPNAGVQVRAHPPLLPMVLGFMDRVGLGGPWWACALVLGVAASGIVAILLAVREVAGEDFARRALPFLVLAPAGLFIATSFDALYLGVGAWFVAAVVFALRPDGPHPTRWAVLGGVLAAISILLSYGMVLLGIIPVFFALRRREWRPVFIAAGTAFACILALVPFGYWWLAGLAACREAYYALGMERPYQYFLFADFSVLALIIGPALAVAIVEARDRRLWLLPAGAAVAMVVADVSGLSTGEVERIWLPFALWLVPVGAVLLRGRLAGRGWLAAQVACPIVLSLFIRTYW